MQIYRQKSDKDPKVLPKSPIPPPTPEVEDFRYSPDLYKPRHEHIDEVREERVFLSQVIIFK